MPSVDVDDGALPAVHLEVAMRLGSGVSDISEAERETLIEEARAERLKWAWNQIDADRSGSHIAPRSRTDADGSDELWAAARLREEAVFLAELVYLGWRKENQGVSKSQDHGTGDCVGCHRRSVALPEGVVLDVERIWPKLAVAGYVQSDRLPVLLDGAEWELWSRGQPDVPRRDCLDCHGAHGEKAADVSLELRRDNVGLWLDVSERKDHLDAVVKVQNVGAGHRVPGGFADRAYAVTVEAFGADDGAGTSLGYWAGPKLPQTVNARPEQGGIFFGRRIVDARGQVALEPASGRDVLGDSRLEPGRFIESHLLFRRTERRDWRVVARLYFLPHSPEWRGAALVTQVVVTPEDIEK
jgi:hypothetical protein